MQRTYDLSISRRSWNATDSGSAYAPLQSRTLDPATARSRQSSSVRYRYACSTAPVSGYSLRNVCRISRSSPWWCDPPCRESPRYRPCAPHGRSARRSPASCGPFRRCWPKAVSLIETSAEALRRFSKLGEQIKIGDYHCVGVRWIGGVLTEVVDADQQPGSDRRGSRPPPHQRSRLR